MNTSTIATHANAPEHFTIDELARHTGVIVSTIRLYQNRGMLAPPTRRGRVGYYDGEHVARLHAITQLQTRGFSLAGIKELLAGMESGETLRTVLGVSGESSIWSSEPTQTMTMFELAAQLPNMEFTPALAQRTIDLGLVEFTEDGANIVVNSPSFLKIGSELAALGIPGDVILDEYEQLQVLTDQVAARFTEIFRKHMWKPFVSKGMPQKEVTPLMLSLDQLAPLSERVTQLALRNSLRLSAENFVRKEAKRLGITIDTPEG